MTPHTLETHQVSERDFDYMWSVYRDCVRDLVEPRLQQEWVDQDQQNRFRTTWDARNCSLLTFDGNPIGWMAASLTPTEVTIDHFYIAPAHQGRGYGTRVLSELLTQWLRQGKVVNASCLKGSHVAACLKDFETSLQGEDELAVHVLMTGVKAQQVEQSEETW